MPVSMDEQLHRAGVSSVIMNIVLCIYMYGKLSYVQVDGHGVSKWKIKTVAETEGNKRCCVVPQKKRKPPWRTE